MSLGEGRWNGFTLLEVVVALLVLAVGLLGVAGMITATARSLETARSLAWTVAEVEEVSDSLALSGVRADGERFSGPVQVSWQVEEEGILASVRIGGRAGADGPRVGVSALLPRAAP